MNGTDVVIEKKLEPELQHQHEAEKRPASEFDIKPEDADSIKKKIKETEE